MNTRSGRFLIISGLTAVTILGGLWSLRFAGETGTLVEKPDPEGISETSAVSEQQADTLNCQSIVPWQLSKRFRAVPCRIRYPPGPRDSRMGPARDPSNSETMLVRLLVNTPLGSARWGRTIWWRSLPRFRPLKPHGLGTRLKSA